jgi:trehalose 6-phosphate synthase/phosphatase
MSAQTIIVSNRLPVSVKKTASGLEFYPSDGGLAKGLGAYAAKRKNLWIGWPGLASDDLSEAEMQEISRGLRKYHCSPVFLTKKEIQRFYNSYSNALLWPHFHTLPADETAEKDWSAYKAINTRFAAAVLDLGEPSSRVWVHDYQLLLVPQMIRATRPRAAIGFFLHIPFPKADHFISLPRARELVRGMLGADLVGFHTKNYSLDFLATCKALNIGSPTEGGLATRGRPVRVTNFPIGIDYQKFALSGRVVAVKKWQYKLQRRYRGKKIILTVDRLDPTKGFIERLEAYRELLRTTPELLGNVQLVMLAVPSRGEVEAYRQLKKKVDTLVHDINDEFGWPRWQPIEYRYESIDFTELAALYRVADVAFVAPIRDGMNLVAKEFVASQSGQGGMLVLSETAGAAEELKDALLVHPEKPTTMVRGLRRALTMPKREVKQRVKSMQAVLADNTIYDWAGSFLRSLNRSNVRLVSTAVEHRLGLAYEAAQSRLLIFDYDGVLAPFAPTPEGAKPTAKLRSLLRKLAKTKNTRLVIISGRDAATLEAWLGDLPVTLIAEHGAKRKLPGLAWEELVTSSSGWKQVVLPLLARHTAQTEGSFVEEKAQKAVARMQQTLPPVLRKHGVRLYRGNKILEIKDPRIHKGSAALALLDRPYDFILCLGDDYTDEDMFISLPKSVYSIKVGPGRTAARFRAEDVASVHALLRRLGG